MIGGLKLVADSFMRTENCGNDTAPVSTSVDGKAVFLRQAKAVVVIHFSSRPLSTASLVLSFPFSQRAYQTFDLAAPKVFIFYVLDSGLFFFQPPSFASAAPVKETLVFSKHFWKYQ